MQICVYEKFLHAFQLRKQAHAASIAASSEAIMGGSPVQTREQATPSTTPASRKRRLGPADEARTPSRTTTSQETPSPDVSKAGKQQFVTPPNKSTMKPVTPEERGDGILKCGHHHPSMKPSTASRVWQFFDMVEDKCGVVSEGKSAGTPFWIFKCNLCPLNRGELRVCLSFDFHSASFLVSSQSVSMMAMTKHFALMPA